MKIRNAIAALVAVAGAALASGSAHASLNGTTMNIAVNHAGPFSAISSVSGVHTYGTPSAFVAAGWGTMNVASPAPVFPAGFDNAVKLDFTSFNYSAFAAPGFATVGTGKFTNLAEAFDLNSVKIFINGVDKTVSHANFGNGFQVSWNTADVLAGSPVTPNVVVAWNSVVPAPGAMALMGLAGVAARGRRRR